jgi:hypothetical protein
MYVSVCTKTCNYVKEKVLCTLTMMETSISFNITGMSCACGSHCTV